MKNLIGLIRRTCLLAGMILIASHARAQSDYTVTARGPDSKVWQKTVVQNGVTNIHRYTELATGMNYTNDVGQLVESREQITIVPQGGAVAVQGRHKVYFPANIYNGVLTVITPDGRSLRSRPLGITYDDGSNTVFIAMLTNAVGYLVSSNQVVYRNAFTGFKADLVCTYRRSGFESDVVFREQPPTPDAYGLDPATTTLQMVTEFFNTQDPQEIPAGSDEWYGLQDSTLKFGKLTMGRGKAFATGTNSNSRLPSPNSSAAVYKRWLNMDGRKFLIEEVPLDYLADDLNALPLTAKLSTPNSQIPSANSLLMASSHRHFPASHEFVADTNQILLASVNLNKEPGVVLDYTTVDSGTGDFVFEGGTTYYVDDWFDFDGYDTVTFEGGTIVKFESSGQTQIGFWCNEGATTVVFTSDIDHPAIFTAKDDDSIGDCISGSTGIPSGHYGVMSFPGGDFMHDVRLSYLAGIDFDSDATIYNIQANDMSAIYSGWLNLTINNGLFYNIGEIRASGCDDGAELHCSQTTFVNCNLTSDSSFYSSCADLVNCILVATVNVSSNYITNCVVILDNSGGVFQTAANANYYLAPNSPYRNIGTTNINPDLLAELRTMTTYAPQDGGFPDTNVSHVDLGYHYPVNEDSDYDGLPDWWEWHWFGNYSMSGTNLDANGNTLLSDYQNYADGTVTNDPNVIEFSIEVANNWVNNSNPDLHLNVTLGMPSYYTVLVDSTNYAAANWTNYTSADITANIGSLQGWHEIWVGLKGHATNASVTWQCKQLKLDFTPPQITITSPSNSVVDVPTIQLTGYSLEDLDSISCDVSNGLQVLTNLDAGVTHRSYDTNLSEFTTNYFEALDIPFTNGLNRITVHATDLAGNVTTTNFNFTVDYSNKTNPPVVSITWPLDGMKICGTNFTLRGQVGDPTVTVTASITDTNGDTNTAAGLVERNGRFWLDNLPLNTGTNTVSITVSDVVGNVTMTNINLVQSALTLTMNPMADDSQLWQPTVSVGGTISDSSYAVWVNGVPGVNNGDGTWSADNVPTTPGGVANFDMTAYPPGEAPDTSTGGSVNPRTANAADTGTNPDKPVRLYMQTYVEVDTGYSHADFDSGAWDNTFDWKAGAGTIWFDNIGGGGGLGFDVRYDNTDGFDGWSHSRSSWLGTCPASKWPDIAVGSIANTYFTEGEDLLHPYSSWTDNSSAEPWRPTLVPEHCRVKQTVGWPLSWPYWWRSSWYPMVTENKGQYQRTADAAMILETGGRAAPKRNSLFCLSGAAGALRDPFAYPSLNEYHEVVWTSMYQPATNAISMQDIKVDGKALGDDGKLWCVYADGSTHEVTPKVKNKDFYAFGISQQKYSMRVKWLKMDGGGSHQITEDNGTSSSYNCVLDNGGNIIRQFPILYESVSLETTPPDYYPTLTGDVYMQATPTFRVYSTGNDPIVIQGEVISGPPYPCNFWQTNTPGGPYDWTTSILADHKITPFRVDYYNPLTIQWRILSPDKSVSVDLEKTECPVYVSLKPPITSELYHTVAHLACSQGHATTEAQAVANTWGQFAGRGVTAWDGRTKLYYYYRGSTAGVPSESLTGILMPPSYSYWIPHNGTCNAWAQLLQASLQVNGIDASLQRVDKNVANFQLVAKNCDFIANINYLEFAPYVCNPPSGFCPPPDGVPGQNTSSPNPDQKLFSYHEIIKVPASCALNGSDIYLDASYGVSAATKLEYTHKAIAGWSDGNGHWLKASDNPAESLDIY